MHELLPPSQIQRVQRDPRNPEPGVTCRRRHTFHIRTPLYIGTNIVSEKSELAACSPEVGHGLQRRENRAQMARVHAHRAYRPRNAWTR